MPPPVPANHRRGRPGGGDPRRSPAAGRAGHRDLDQIIGHVIGADTAYVRKLGIKHKLPATGGTASIGELREAIAAVVGTPSDGSPVIPSGWITRYAARRIAWHVLEHAWEMQDRAESES